MKEQEKILIVQSLHHSNRFRKNSIILHILPPQANPASAADLVFLSLLSRSLNATQRVLPHTLIFQIL
jgi:hypothetical protein